MSRIVVVGLCLLLLLAFCSSFSVVQARPFGGVFEERFQLRTLVQELEAGTSYLITAVRSVVALVTVIIAISLGLTLWAGQSSQALESVKVRFALLFLGILVVFMTEDIIKFIFYILGWRG